MRRVVRQHGIRRRDFERLIAEPEKLSEAVSEFDDVLWGCLVEYMTVGKDKMMIRLPFARHLERRQKGIEMT